MELKDLVKEWIDQDLEELNVALPAMIEKYDPEALIASITVLARKKLNGKAVTIPPIVEVPVVVYKAGPFVMRPPYKPGDVVQVLFNQRALDSLMVSGKPQEVTLTRRFSMDDAVVIGGLRVKNQPKIPAEYSDCFYIANPGAGAKVVMKPSGDIILEAGAIYLGEGAAEGVPLGTSLKEWLDGHQHPYTWAHDPGGGDTGAPTEESPAPSSIVKVK
jgi:hypothetical protein